MSFIYIASPYSGTAEQKQRRYEAALHAVGILSEFRFAVYSPIVHFHEVARRHNLPTDADFWHRVNMAMLSAARCLWVLTIDGWDKSAGVEREIREAQKLKKQVTYIHALPKRD